MSAGRAKLRHRETGKRIAIGDGVNLRWVPFFQNNPYIVQPGEPLTGAEWIVDYPGHRPYINYYATKILAQQKPGRLTRRNRYGVRWVWDLDHRPEPAEFFLAQDEKSRFDVLRAGKSYVIIEPHVKAKAPPAKCWPFSYYQAVVRDFAGKVDFIQFDLGQSLLRGVTSVKCDFRGACVWMKAAAAYLGNEGALHHVAAAVETKAVVIFGAYIPPTVTGYPTHKNFYVHNSRVLGLRIRCRDSDLALESIKPDVVADALAEML